MSALAALIALTALGAAACGVQPVGSAPPDPEAPPPIALVGGIDGVNRVLDADGNARYLGEVSNGGEVVACNVNLSINSYDAFGNLLNNPGNSQLSAGDVFGESFRFSAFTTQGYDNCISPGKRASFDIRNDFALSRVVSIAVAIPCADPDLYKGCIAGDPPFALPSADLVVEGAIVEGVTGDGRLLYTGTVRNQNPLGSVAAYHVKIVLTAHNAAGLVVDVGCARMDYATCPPPANATLSNARLDPGQLWVFNVPLSIVPGVACTGCVSSVINQKAP